MNCPTCKKDYHPQEGPECHKCSDAKEKALDPSDVPRRVRLSEELDSLVLHMRVVSSKMEYFGGFNPEIVQHSREMAGAANIARGWAKHMRLEEPEIGPDDSGRQIIADDQRERLNRGLRTLASWCASRAMLDHEPETTLALLEKKAAELRLCLTPCSRSWLTCDVCGKLWEDTAENLGGMCECGRVCIRMEWATEKERLAAISSENAKCPSVDEKGTK